MRDSVRRLALEVEGIVQGVGFRPFVYRLARALSLGGGVLNTPRGVRIEVEGEPELIEQFTRRLRAEAPPNSMIARVTRRRIPTLGERSFSIRPSEGGDNRSVLVAPDTAVCADCLFEMRDPGNRRYRYPFINCTNCGPRFTIIRDIPYDRALTTMKGFEMCAGCRAEFEDPLDRRFHAQPNACPVCGPRVALVKGDGARRMVKGEDPVVTAGKAILAGLILAVKGLGGFHLAADAAGEDAVGRLRERKRRQGKPFAVMFPDLETVRRYCRLNRGSEAALIGPERPIVLLDVLRRGERLAPSVAPSQVTLGVMLPYTPLHHLLIEAAGNRPLVMTSGNYSDEPIAASNADALAGLSSIADLFLLHDRPIHIRADDSVVVARNGHATPVRRSRGYVPAPVRLRRPLAPVLAVGAQLKNTVCLVRGADAFLSQHVGDIEGVDTYEYFLDTVEQLKRLLDLTPDRVACDLHPDYLSTRWAHLKSGLPVVGVQHHHAHVVSCMAEHGLEEKALGVAFDGTGYGLDGTIWGGEFLTVDERSFERAGHLPCLRLPGGDAAVRETWRTARAALRDTLGPEALNQLDLPVWKTVERAKLDAVDRMLESGLNCPASSGCGRLFDAVAAIAGLRSESLYEGQAAIELEAAAMRCPPGKAIRYCGDIDEREGLLVPDTAELLEAVARDAAAGVDVPRIARGFHDWLGRVTVDTASRIAGRLGLERVVLSGGVFNNRLLGVSVARGLGRLGFRVYEHRLIPPGDGGLSLGQAVIAAAVDI